MSPEERSMVTAANSSVFEDPADKPRGRPVGSCKLVQDFEGSNMSEAAFASSRAIIYREARVQMLYPKDKALARAMGTCARTAVNYRLRAEDGEQPFAEIFRRIAEVEDEIRIKELGQLIPLLRDKDPGRLMSMLFADLDPAKVDARVIQAKARELAAASMGIILERFELELAKDSTIRDPADCARLLGIIVDRSVAAMADGRG